MRSRSAMMFTGRVVSRMAAPKVMNPLSSKAIALAASSRPRPTYTMSSMIVNPRAIQAREIAFSTAMTASEGTLIREDERLGHTIAHRGRKLRLPDLALGEEAEGIVAGGIGEDARRRHVAARVDIRLHSHHSVRAAVGERRRRCLHELVIGIGGATPPCACRPFANDMLRRYEADHAVAEADAIPFVAGVEERKTLSPPHLTDHVRRRCRLSPDVQRRGGHFYAADCFLFTRNFTRLRDWAGRRRSGARRENQDKKKKSPHDPSRFTRT